MRTSSLNKLSIFLTPGLFLALYGCESKLQVKTAEVAPTCQKDNSCPIDQTSAEPDASTPEPSATHVDTSKENLGLGFERAQYQTLSVKRFNNYTALAAKVNGVTITLNDKELQCSINKAVPDLFAATAAVKTMIDPISQFDLLSALTYGTNTVTISIGGANVGAIPGNQTTQTITLRDFEVFDFAVLASGDELDGTELTTDSSPQLRGWVSPLSGTSYATGTALSVGFDDIITY